MNLNIDLGQTLTITAVGLIGWLLNSKMSGIDHRLDNHENRIFNLWKVMVDNQRGWSHSRHDFDEADDKG